MYNLDEIKLQNQQDVWSLLYLHLARSVISVCGRSGEGSVREAVRRMCIEQGKHLHSEHVKAGLKTNLKTLYSVGCNAVQDPRVNERVLSNTDQVRLWEVYSCPMADLWNKAGAAKLGLMYCEESQRALLAGYTEEKGQLNLSTVLTCPRDLHCRFSVYFRPANTTGTLRAESFGLPGESCGGEENLKKVRDVSFHEMINAECIQFFSALLETATAVFGSEGKCAVVLGLQSLAETLIPVMVKHASDVLEPCDRAFFQENFPLSLETEKDALWHEQSNKKGAMLMQKHLLDPLKSHFGM